MEATTPAPADPPEPDHLALDEFPAADLDDWRELARAVLVKAGRPDDVDPVAALTRTDLDGIAVAPLYLDGPELTPVTRAPGAWDIRVRHDDSDPARANAAVLADLEGGASSLWLRIGSGAIAPADLPRVLDGVLLDLVAVVLDAGPELEAAAESLAQVAGGTALRGSLGIDPVAWSFRHGEQPAEWAEVTSSQGLTPVTVDGTAYADAGATDADEIAFATATAVAHLRAGGAFDDVEFRFAVTDRQFPSIAKLRAARRVWARIAELSGEPAAVQRQHAVTAAAMFSVRDPWVNMLRATVAGFGAAAGGADAITVHPFDLAVGRPVPFARRIARNVHAILHDEASLARVADPAGGSWYVETLTDALAQRAWERFTAVEREGGIIAALRNGLVGEAVEAAAGERDRRIATRALPLTGVSEFAHLDEAPLEREDAPQAPGLRRWAAPYEEWRDRSDAVLASTGARPTVQLLALGGRGKSAARVSFATNLFHTGGLAVEVLTDAAECNGPVVCLCSSDAVYAEEGAAAAAAVRAAGAQQVWLAGAREVDGVDARLYLGCDTLDVLGRVWEVLDPSTAATAEVTA
ncbi:methylmalonyl-CoA mutase family protein [Jatrophihabitans sp. YIM 134969]